METQVVNKHHGGPFDVYIGRGSKWGNDFSHREGTKARFLVATREEAVEAYREQLWQAVLERRVTLTELSELHGKRLQCYCAPQACHGDVLAAAAEWAVEALKERA